MHKKHVLVVLGVLSAVAAGTAMAAPTPLPGTRVEPAAPPVERVTWTCPAMIAANATTFQTDWTLFAPQGWLDHGEIAKADAGSLFRCYYGVDKASPAGRPAFFIHRVIPASYTSCVLTGPSNTSLTCATR
jgi:hypothetical protein